MKTKKITFIILALGFLTFIACEKVEVTKKTSPEVLPQVMNNPSGLGSNPGQPYCAPYSFPASIELIGDMQSSPFKAQLTDKENQNIEDFIIQSKNNHIILGSGSLVQVNMKLHNKSTVKQTLIFPGGLMFLPEDTTSQTGVIVQNDTVIIDPNDTTTVLLKSYCTNLHKGVHQTKFKMIGISLHSDIWKVVDILSRKKKLSQGSNLQSIIWNISDHGGITEADINYLNNLP